MAAGSALRSCFGVAAFEKAEDRLEDLLSAADEAMYKSKSGGRNRVTLAAYPSPEADEGTSSATHTESHVED